LKVVKPALYRSFCYARAVRGESRMHGSAAGGIP
jgi:hypothetical protein